MIVIGTKILHPAAQLPQKATAGAACYDLHAVERTLVTNGRISWLRFGLAVELPQGYVMKLFVRSGMAKRGLMLANGVGIVDSDYRGEVVALVTLKPPVPISDGYPDKPYEEDTLVIDPGTRVCQAMIQRVQDATFEQWDELTPTDRGEGGFGSTGQ